MATHKSMTTRDQRRESMTTRGQRRESMTDALEVLDESMSFMECTKTVRATKNGAITIDLYKITKIDGTVQVRLELLFVRKSDHKIYSLVVSDESLRSSVKLDGDPMKISLWLNNIGHAIPLSRECVVVFVHEDRYSGLGTMAFTLLEEVDSHQEQKIVNDLTTRLAVRSLEIDELTQDRDAAVTRVEELQAKVALLSAELGKAREENMVTRAVDTESRKRVRKAAIGFAD